jgi:peptidoglycan/xylan/chitin deacetylase (PgdA/CDA1 family)
MSALEHRYDVKDGVVALTFDDGPSPWTEQILDLLAAHDGRATFFALGCLAADDERGPTLRRVVESGCEVGNHTFTHPHLTEIGDEEIRDEFERAGGAIEAATSTRPRLWRPPFFHVDERVRAAVAPFGLLEVGCSMMPWDWEWDSDRTVEFVLERLRPGSIVCMHDGRPPDEPAELSRPTREATVTAVGVILETMRERGLRSVTITELLAQPTS